jgi:hypothetical protein
MYRFTRDMLDTYLKGELTRATPVATRLPHHRQPPGEFSVKTRPGDPFDFVCFRAPDGRRLERATKETSRKRAVDAAPALIKEVYEPQAVATSVTWDEAVAAIDRRMRENNNKTRTIEDYADTLRLIERLFPDTRWPGDITAAMARSSSHSTSGSTPGGRSGRRRCGRGWGASRSCRPSRRCTPARPAPPPVGSTCCGSCGASGSSRN